MSSILTKSKLSALAVGSLAGLACFSAPPAHAAACGPSQVLPLASTPLICTLGDVTYTFGSDLGEFGSGNIVFTDGPTLQSISFVPAPAVSASLIAFTLGTSIAAPNTITSVTSEVVQSGTTTLDALFYPVSGSTSPFTTGEIIVAYSGTGTLMSYTLKVTKTPGPLPLLGAGVAFGMSRKLRRSIKKAA